jgi:hypothetical protein
MHLSLHGKSWALCCWLPSLLISGGNRVATMMDGRAEQEGDASV